jgi:lipopolysaccharide/colanic/teichoic acid biosynthesis glycosyltransferase
VIMERFFDILFASIALIILAPLLVLVALVLRFTGEGEIFYCQERVGQNRKLFKLYKFATMVKASPTIGTGTITVKNDPRVLPFGRILRKTKINELPQLINILLGSMSIVGPRPQAPRNFEDFPIDAQRKIVLVRPGLSGLGSILFRCEEEILDLRNDNLGFYKNVISNYKGAIEVWYIDNRSLGRYFMVIFITMCALISSSSSLVWQVFKGIPVPPDELKDALKYGG